METTRTEQEHKMTKPEPLPEHDWLQDLVGEWTAHFEATDAGKATWTEKVRSIGGLWIVAEGEGEMPGCGQSTTIMTLGYDPQKKKYLGTFIASMMTHMWAYEGTRDPAGNVLRLDTEGPDMATEGKMAKYQDVIELKSKDERVLSSHMLGDDGQWHQIMLVTYRRKK